MPGRLTTLPTGQCWPAGGPGGWRWRNRGGSGPAGHRDGAVVPSPVRVAGRRNHHGHAGSGGPCQPAVPLTRSGSWPAAAGCCPAVAAAADSCRPDRSGPPAGNSHCYPGNGCRCRCSRSGSGPGPPTHRRGFPSNGARAPAAPGPAGSSRCGPRAWPARRNGPCPRAGSRTGRRPGPGAAGLPWRRPWC